MSLLLTMSLTTTFIIVGIILLILFILVGSIIFNASQRRRIAQLMQDLEEIDNHEADEQVERLKIMALSGESLTSFDNWKKIYEEIKETKLPDLQKRLEEVAESNASYKIFETKKTVASLEEDLEEVQGDLIDAKAVFAQLLQSDHDNAEQLGVLLKDYQEERKNILSNSFKYGASLDQLEDRLTELESDFDMVKTLSDEGDHVEAKRVLSRINMNLTDLNETLPKLEKAQHEVRTEFPDQLDEITAVFKKMDAEHYNFSELDILSKVREVRKEIDQSNNFIRLVEVEKLIKNNEKIEQDIEQLYSAMETEMKSRKVVEGRQDHLVQFFNHASSQSHQLIKKLDHIDQSYQLTHGELQEANNLDSEINQMQSDFEIDRQKMADGEAIYSAIENDFLRVEARLTAIEARQKEISDDVDGLFEAEKIAQGSLDRFAQDVSLIKRRIDRQRLPGLPREFIDFYNVVLNEISDLNSELNQVRINLEQISNKLILVQKDINRLRDDADSIIESAHLVENTVQYSNKYIASAEIKLAIQDAMKLYQEDFEYKKALDTIATALEKSEPGAFHRIEQDYVKEND